MKTLPTPKPQPPLVAEGDLQRSGKESNSPVRITTVTPVANGHTSQPRTTTVTQVSDVQNMTSSNGNAIHIENSSKIPATTTTNVQDMIDKLNHVDKSNNVDKSPVTPTPSTTTVVENPNLTAVPRTPVMTSSSTQAPSPDASFVKNTTSSTLVMTEIATSDDMTSPDPRNFEENSEITPDKRDVMGVLRQMRSFRNLSTLLETKAAVIRCEISPKFPIFISRNCASIE